VPVCLVSGTGSVVREVQGVFSVFFVMQCSSITHLVPCTLAFREALRLFCQDLLASKSEPTGIVCSMYRAVREERGKHRTTARI